jgi:molecular chaperone GrpE (heat shock protein)
MLCISFKTGFSRKSAREQSSSVSRTTARFLTLTLPNTDSFTSATLHFPGREEAVVLRKIDSGLQLTLPKLTTGGFVIVESTQKQ